MMHSSALLLSILVSSVLVFIASSLIHMASPWHKRDYPRFAREREILDALRPLDIPPGDYFMPRPSGMAEMKSPEFAETMKRGPVVLMTVFPNGVMPMGGTMVKWFVYLLVVSAIAGHAAAGALPPGASSHQVFHTVGLTAFAGYALALWQLSIWYRRSLSITIKSTVDGLIYAAITAGVFVWLWPK
ncbi:MAG: hypothetical protein HOQ31_02695 [Gemmatimonadaceae bacterium]|nr:hypothetical protein [Gemmatimonadaceae bacterium]NUP72414.1 hypothetical protein [Gemmatimonadaceae bacterium]NUR33749.1 hypothetical protein [Gemmatimonadaceae bacterium]